ncbi:MAG: AmmeMemoRadiSam system protein B [Sedimentisphaerales bacterium]|nr:AmmeMemoRadiSam system protein B [Sedimentisphaerales bacterium]
MNMQKRRPIVAGQFYPDRKDQCIDEITQCLEEIKLTPHLPDEIVAGIVPHAGWTFSGATAAFVFAAIKQRHPKVDTFVIFGAAHGYLGQPPAVYDKGGWLTPLGEIAIDEELAAAILESKTAVSDCDAHNSEHSMEVQVPFIQHLFPDAKILPILTPPSEQAIPLGKIVASLITSDDERKIVCLGSTDLTHYGPRYGFTPMGAGKEGLKWATEVNDRQFIDFALKLQPEKLLETAAENYNACGAGAAAATVTVAKALGKTKGVLLAHTNSNEIMLKKMGVSSRESVGYAAIVF